jgi:hypothetical protein
MYLVAADGTDNPTHNVLAKFADVLINANLDAADEYIELVCTGLGSAGIQITNTWTGTLEFRGTVDGTNWTQTRAVQFGGTLVGGTTVNGMFFAQVGGLLKFRVYATAWTGGTATIYIEGTAATSAITLANALPTGTNSIGQVKIEDATVAANKLTLADTFQPANATDFLMPICGSYWDGESRIYVPVAVDGSGHVHVAFTVADTLSVTLGAALPAGTNAIGTVSTKTALTASAPTAVSVGVASGVVIAANANRKGLVLVNTSTASISLNCVGGAAVLYSGITLNAGGGVWVMDEYTFTTAEIRGIASAAASNLAIQEYT